MYSEITGYRIKNLRSIGDSKDIAIHDLNILVGKNGTGKSTFMKFFQVLSQSIRSQKKFHCYFMVMKLTSEVLKNRFLEKVQIKASVLVLIFKLKTITLKT